ncbi:MAG: hypothetical protein L6R38_001988, partial [Xanthoria sp. 2 TBL-2021]
MYKTRIHKWKIGKNVKAEEMKAIVRKQAQRAITGKQSAFRLRDVEVPEHKIDRFRKTAGLLSLEQALRVGAATPTRLVCYTPLRSPLRTPSTLAIPEKITKLVQDYILGSFESNTWEIQQDQLWPYGPSIEDTSTGAFHGTFYLARQLLDAHQDEYAWQVLDMALACLEPMLRAEKPFTLKKIVSILLIHFFRIGHRFTSHILEHLSAMSTNVKTQNHPFSHIFRALLDVESLQLEHVIYVLQQVQSDSFAQQIGPLHSITLHLRLWNLSRVNLEGFDVARASLNLLREVEHTLGRLDVRSLQPARPREFLSSALYTLAKAQFELSRPSLAEQNMHHSIALRVSKFGFEDETTLRYMFELENMLGKMGRNHEAAAMRRQ